MNAISRRVYFRGFTFSEFINRYPEALDFYSENIQKGKIKIYDHIFNGIQKYEEAIKFMYSG